MKYVSQQEARLERQEQRLHNKAVRAAVHGNIGKAITLEVQFLCCVGHLDIFNGTLSLSLSMILYSMAKGAL